jgi:hypothetical protein
MRLAVCLMFEKSLGCASDFAPYIKVLPDREPVPFTWKPADVSLLKGTELEELVRLKCKQVEEEWTAFIQPMTTRFPQEFPARSFSLAEYISATSVVLSRCFPTAHGAGLVPWADLLNHEHEPAALYEEEHGEEGRDGRGAGGMDAAIVMQRCCDAGAEVYHTYGNLSSAELLFRYGFLDTCSAPSSAEYVSVSQGLLAQACKNVGMVSSEEAQRRLDMLVQCNVLSDELELQSIGSENGDGTTGDGTTDAEPNLPTTLLLVSCVLSLAGEQYGR